MSTPSPSVYARLRAAASQTAAFHEDQDIPPEQLLQAIWKHQRLHRDRLKTTTGQRVFILHPGFLNREAGPDFRNAIVQIADEAPQTGDVEVDPRPLDWLHHKHHSNPAYAGVVLHVVWRSTPSKPSPANRPLLELAPVIDAPVAELSEWLQPAATETPPRIGGSCQAPLRDLTAAQMETLLHQAALFRLQARAQHLKARAREAGWTQALWEGIFRALGYKHNRWPMQHLAESRRHWETPAGSSTTLLARLLGMSGLLPPESGRRHSPASAYVRELWDCWWRERERLQADALPRTAWRLAGIRPANHPQRRLALAAHWIRQGDLPDRLQAWCGRSCAGSRLPGSLVKLLSPGTDPYWSHHYTLHSRTSREPIPLLGIDRATDLAANVILPWLWARARQGRRTQVCHEIERRYLSWPGGPDNAVLRLARQRLLGRQRTALPPRMAAQQGLLQIVSDYCDRSDSLCRRCGFPDVARRFGEA